MSRMVDDRGIVDFPEVNQLLSNAGLKGRRLKITLIGMIVKALSKHLSGGLLELTIEEIRKDKRYKDSLHAERDYVLIGSLSKDLPSIESHVEFVVKAGGKAVGKASYNFTTQPKVELEGVKGFVKERSVSLGTFVVSITLYLLKDGHRLKIGNLKKSLRLPESIPLGRH